MTTNCLTISVEQAAELLGISRNTAYQHARSGALPTIRMGRRLIVPKAALEKLLASTGTGGQQPELAGGQAHKSK